jgi:dihydrofolate reductase
LVYGGAGFVSSLIAGGHIDEFLFFVNPAMINKGIKIFDLLDKLQQLSLISATPYECDVTVLRYKLNPIKDQHFYYGYTKQYNYRH